MNVFEFFKRWKAGIANLTIAQQLHGKIAGIWGNIIGMGTGALFMIFYCFIMKEYKWWWTIIVLLAGTYLNVIELIGTKQQYRQACETQAIINSMKVQK